MRTQTARRAIPFHLDPFPPTLDQILSVYMSGSKNMSYDSSNLTTPDIKWLGIRPSDLNRCDEAGMMHVMSPPAT